MNTRSVEVLRELEEILKANPLLAYVSAGEGVVPLASETNTVAAYINMTNGIPRVTRNSTELDGYDISGFYTIVINSDCTTERDLIYDAVDSVMRSVLNDAPIWNKLIDRDIINIEYDNAEFFPKRSAVIAIEVVYRMTCTA